MFQRRGTTNIELFGHTGFPATNINPTLSVASVAGATGARLNNTTGLMAGDKLTDRHGRQSRDRDDRHDRVARAGQSG